MFGLFCFYIPYHVLVYAADAW